MAEDGNGEEQFMSSFEVKGDNNKLTTEIDILYKLIKDQKVIKLSLAAKKLNLPKEKIQEWADVLENHRMIDILYPVVGDPVLKIKMSRQEEKKWRDIEDDLRKKDMKQKKHVPKSPILFILLLGLGAVFVYMTDLRNIISSRVLNFIYDTPQIMQLLDMLPFRDMIIVNVVHVTFAAFLVVVFLVFGIWKFVTRGSRRKPAHHSYEPKHAAAPHQKHETAQAHKPHPVRKHPVRAHPARKKHVTRKRVKRPKHRKGK